MKSPSQAGVPPPLPVGPVLAVTASTQALSTLGILALASVAPNAAAHLHVSAALIGYQVGLVFFGAMLSALFAGGLVMRFGAVRTSQLSLWTIAAGCSCSALGTMPALVAGAFVMGLGYGAPNPAASQLLARVPSGRSMNLLFSIKQTGVPIGGALSGLIVPPLTVVLGWQAALAICALMLALLGGAIGVVRTAWDAERLPTAPLASAGAASLALVWKHKPLRWLAGASFLYSGVQLSLTGFLVTYLVSEVHLSLVVAGTLLAITHAAGAVGRLVWGWLADRLGSGGLVLILIGCFAVGCALVTAAMSADWPLAASALAVAAFGFCAMGWNGVYIAIIARQSPPGSIALATGGSLGITYAGVIVVPPVLAALHDELALSYGMAYALMAVVTAAGIACVVQARRSGNR